MSETTADRIAELEREVADLKRQNVELREAVAALLAPDPPATSIWDQFSRPI